MNYLQGNALRAGCAVDHYFLKTTQVLLFTEMLTV